MTGNGDAFHFQPSTQRVLAVLQRCKLARTKHQLARSARVSPSTVRVAITTLRGARYNIRNGGWGVGFWLADGTAPPIAEPGSHDPRWKSVPPKRSGRPAKAASRRPS